MNESLSLLYFPTALALGALHALEPGHAKALTASYLIGIKGTKTDAALLGVSVALTHSIAVILISAIGLWLGSNSFSATATEWLMRASGIIAICIGAFMLHRRIKSSHSHSHTKKHNHDHQHHHDHDHSFLDEQAHAAAHARQVTQHLAHAVPRGQRPNKGQIIAFGLAGGMIPCPASITVMLLALSAGKPALGLFTVTGFSLGLAITLVGIGMAVVSGLKQIESNPHWSALSRHAPSVSAVLVIFSGVFALIAAH